ncbi:natural resistance-associated macrophage protein-domain-containing protein [Endogone sp. FLAS-F59071]|nr:natural resistance-associated macrophage protein-domain-containing protein [Endogone sp. FLAS-F59071]|eukprot:RUS19516.1 natural resistance-associated macrophage protein-domain-containing protein [Endogone sp. FLAS-F59071]
MAFSKLTIAKAWNSSWNYFTALLMFVGPGYVIAVGYMDPGNWATDLAGGSQYGYTLLFIIFLSNLLAILLQFLAIKLGVVTGLDLAQACRIHFPRWLNISLYLLCEGAIVACDLAEVIGSAIALKLLFNIPLPAGVAITALDVLIILFGYHDENGTSMRVVRLFECFVMLLVGGVAMCFVVELSYSGADAVQVLKGYLPSATLFQDSGLLYVAVGIIGATVMPHNLYLHSKLVQSRSSFRRNQLKKEQYIQSEVCATSDELILSPHNLSSDPHPPSTSMPPSFDRTSMLRQTIRTTLHFSNMDSVIALTLALFVNSAILIVSAANFYYSPPSSPQHQQIGDLFSAHDLLVSALGPTAGLFYALGLLFAGQSSTLTATMAGQIIMQGFLGLTVRPWLRRLVTRLIAIVPAMVVAIVAGNQGLNGLLVGSQVALSLQLPFAVVPLVWFTSSRRIMRAQLDELNEPEAEEGRTRTKMSEHRPLDAHEEADLAMQRMPDPLPLSVAISSDFQDSELPPLPSTGTAFLPPRRRASSERNPVGCRAVRGAKATGDGDEDRARTGAEGESSARLYEFLVADDARCGGERADYCVERDVTGANF